MLPLVLYPCLLSKISHFPQILLHPPETWQEKTNLEPDDSPCTSPREPPFSLHPYCPDDVTPTLA